ncbi:TAXI family TRAP transporter solute-binding subunit [Micromonospora sp. NPDC001898]|uniref:TAXI family TRAP transporter solute-binding subunit n=1 Tax=Micromonospora sp. NPDC001898 TaxID=3364221 RepID=UPI0036BEE699
MVRADSGFENGSVDGLSWSGDLPTNGITDLFRTSGDKVRFSDISPLLPQLAGLNPAYQAGAIGKDTYRTGTDTPTIVMPNVLLIRTDLDANVACAVTKTLFEKKDTPAQASPAAAAGISLDTARRTDLVPLHLGAAAR